MPEKDRLAITDVIIKPVISEKSYSLLERGVYTFLVRPKATKADVRRAVELAFDVKVRRVNTSAVKGKRVRNLRTGRIGKRPDAKKAYVFLEPGQRIELFEELKG
jgi:large subunit ribosomal protein L23